VKGILALRIHRAGLQHVGLDHVLRCLRIADDGVAARLQLLDQGIFQVYLRMIGGVADADIDGAPGLGHGIEEYGVAHVRLHVEILLINQRGSRLAPGQGEAQANRWQQPSGCADIRKHHVSSHRKTTTLLS
jgi:hypothetical protein